MINVQFAVALSMLSFAFCVYMGARNQWVSVKRGRYIHHLYNRSPSNWWGIHNSHSVEEVLGDYNRMMLMFWCWNFRKLVIHPDRYDMIMGISTEDDRAMV